MLAKAKLRIYGNCQAGCIAGFLKRSHEVNELFDISAFRGAHEISLNEIQDAKTDLQTAAVFLTQHVSDGFRGSEFSSLALKSHLPSSAVVISYPSIYFDAYFPNLLYLSGERGLFTGPGGDYHDKEILGGYAGSLTIDETISSLLDESRYDATSVLMRFDTWLVNMREREKVLDVGISDFIAAEFRNSRLFYTFNHPTNVVMLEVCKTIAKLLSVAFEDGRLLGVDNWLSSVSMPLHPSVRSAFRLRFPYEAKYNLGNKQRGVSMATAVRLFFEFYSNNPASVVAYEKSVNSGAK
jgi:hypothetical protein